MRRTSILAVLAMLAVLLSPNVPVAHAVPDVTYTADFEPDGTTIHSGDQLTNQYPFVTFDSNNVNGAGWTFGTPGPSNPGVLASVGYENPFVHAGNAHAGSYSGQVLCPAEFCTHGTYGLLNYTADSVSIYAGDGAGSNPVELDAYDSSKNFVGSDMETPSSTGASKLLSVTAPTGTSIAYFTVYQTGAGGGFDGSNDLYVDDLTISVPAGVAPQIGVTAPLSSYEIGQDGEIIVPLTLHRINGATGAATVGVTGFKNGVTGSASDPGTGNSSTLTIDASHTASLSGTVPLTVSASAPDTESEPSITVTIQVVPPVMAITAPNNETMLTCSTHKFTVEAQVAPGEPGSQVTFYTAVSGLTASATSPATISNGLADSQVTLTSSGGGSHSDLAVYATLSNGDQGAVDIPIVRNPATVTAVGPLNGKVAHTPRARGHGTSIEVYGHGLCDAATVAVGNQQATVAANVQHLSNGQGPYDYVRIETPRLATTGHVTVTTGSPSMTSVPSSGTLTVDSYRNTNGWNFHNFDPQLTWDDMVQAFGHNQTYFQIDPCAISTGGLAHCPADLFPDPSALIWWGISQGFESGACFGMSLATQRILEGVDSLTGNPATIYDAPAPDTSDAAQNQHGVQPVLDLIKADHLMQLSTEFLAQFLGAQLGASFGFTDSDAVATAIDNVMAKGRFPLIQLVDGTGHILVAYDIATTGPSAYDIYVYDVNDQFTAEEDHPQLDNGALPDGGNHDQRMTGSVIHLASDGSWTLASTTDDSKASYHGGLANINVFDPNVVPAKPTLGSASSGVNGLAGLFANSSGPPNGGSAVKASAAAITQMSSGGKTLYTGNTLNTDSSTRLHAAPFAPIVGSASKPGPDLIAVAGNVHDLSVSTTGTSSGPDALTFVQGGYAGEVDASTSNGSSQQESFGSDTGTVGYTGTTAKPVDLQVVHNASGGARTVGVHFGSGGKGDHLALAKKGTVTLSHSGNATTYSLTFSGGGSKGLPGTFMTHALHIGAGQKLTVSKIRWTSLSGRTMKLRIGSHNVLVHNQAPGLRKPKITRLGVKRHGHHLAARLVATLPKLSHAGRTDVVWLVRRGHHVIHKKVVSLAAKGRHLHQTWRTKASGRHLTVTATVLVVAMNGADESAATASRSQAIRGRG